LVTRLLSKLSPFDLKRQKFHRRLKNFYSTTIEKGDLCIDVGANVGDFTRALSSCGAHVVAVEPQRDCLKKLRTKYQNYPGVTIVGSALGAAPGGGKIYLVESHTVASMSREWITSVKRCGRFQDQGWQVTQDVEIITLDSLIVNYGLPNYVKIDVEGYELQVLKGLSVSVPLLSFEFTPESPSDALNCIDHLSRLGTIHINHTVDRYRAMAFSNWMDTREASTYFSAWSARGVMRIADIFVRTDACQD